MARACSCGDEPIAGFALHLLSSFRFPERCPQQGGWPSPAAVAELDLLGADGNFLSHDGWTVAYVDSEERQQMTGSAENVIDGQTANFWHTELRNNLADHQHVLILNLGKSQMVSGLRYVPRQDENEGRIKDYRIYVGDDLIRKTSSP